jgi:hypothetical protein
MIIEGMTITTTMVATLRRAVITTNAVTPLTTNPIGPRSK